MVVRRICCRVVCRPSSALWWLSPSTPLTLPSLSLSLSPSFVSCSHRPHCAHSRSETRLLSNGCLSRDAVVISPAAEAVASGHSRRQTADTQTTRFCSFFDYFTFFIVAFRFGKLSGDVRYGQESAKLRWRLTNLRKKHIPKTALLSWERYTRGIASSCSSVYKICKKKLNDTSELARYSNFRVLIMAAGIICNHRCKKTFTKYNKTLKTLETWPI